MYHRIRCHLPDNEPKIVLGSLNVIKKAISRNTDKYWLLYKFVLLSGWEKWSAKEAFQNILRRKSKSAQRSACLI